MEYQAETDANKVTRTLQEKFDAHQKDKSETREERESDRKSTNKTEAIICFDLQNALTCPRANVSNFFYKRKLNVFNLTAHCSLDKKAYNAIWAECIAGRGANEIASALQVIRCAVLKDHPQVNSIILWSDSCVPQNRNSVMSLALKIFISQNPSINKIAQKFLTPGHSSIQEVDNIHSHLEKGLRISEIYSPVSLLRVLRNIRPKHSNVIQLQKSRFYNFQRVSSSLKSSNVPYLKVKHIQYVSGKPSHVSSKCPLQT